MTCLHLIPTRHLRKTTIGEKYSKIGWGGPFVIDETLLLAILRSIEEVLSKQTTRVSIEKKARLIATLYKMQPALPIERSAVCQMIELIG